MAMLTGQCLCGAVRYRVSEMPSRVNYCHCSQCRRFTGAPVFAAALMPRDALAVDGATRTFRSSLHGVRHFCSTCGSSLFFEFDTRPDRIEILVGTLDDASNVIPTFHGFDAERIAWFDVRDDLPRHAAMP
ncbi:hypothetical protein WS52_30535 [Burkholderia territorii]|nr:hypothetical protein WS52_30535 [Burkholderia territorii]KUZ58356.1 hypothetical protein WS53_09470 [Burkholderia territorii]